MIARFCVSIIVAIYFSLCECRLPRFCFVTLADSRNDKIFRIRLNMTKMSFSK
ncbi:hypothetical protein [Helicobacter sp. T3_23-1056]